MTNQRCCKIQRLLYIKLHIYKLLTIFNVLPYATSLLRTECEGTTVTAYKCKMYTYCGYKPLILFLDAISLMDFSFTPRPLFPWNPMNSRLCGLHVLFAWFGEEKNLLPLPGVEPRLLGFTTFMVDTIMITLIRLPLLEISWFVVRGSYNGRIDACNCIQFNIIITPCLLLLINIM